MKTTAKKRAAKPATKPSAKPRVRKLRLTIAWGNSYYIDWVADLERLLRKKPRAVQIEIVGAGEIPADAALIIRAALLKRSPKTRLIMDARSTIQNGTVAIWLMGDTRTIREDARVFFRRADLPEDAEVDPNASWKLDEAAYRDSFSALDPDEGDHARVLQVIDEFLPVKEFTGRLIGRAVLKQFGLVDNDRVDHFLANAFAKTGANNLC